MSYENENCPCGGKKERQTMLCSECQAAFHDRRELQTYQDGREDIQTRRHSALILLSLSRGRKRERELREARTAKLHPYYG